MDFEQFSEMVDRICADHSRRQPPAISAGAIDQDIIDDLLGLNPEDKIHQMAATASSNRRDKKKLTMDCFDIAATEMVRAAAWRSKEDWIVDVAHLLREMVHQERDACAQTALDFSTFLMMQEAVTAGHIASAIMNRCEQDAKSTSP